MAAGLKKRAGESATLALVLLKLDRVMALLEAQAAEQARAIPARPMSLAEVGKIVGRDVKTVRRWIAGRKLRAKREGHTWLVTPANLQRFIEPEGSR